MIKIVTADYEDCIKNIRKRTSISDRPEEEKVRQIVRDVRHNGNRALLKYVSEFEFPANIFFNLKVTETEIDLAYSRVDHEFIRVMQRAIENIRRYHEATLLRSWSKPILTNSNYGMKVTPIRRVGVYVPGGTAAYPSSVLMNVIPAQLAGVEQIVMVSPSNKEGKISDAVLAAARELGVTEIYRMGGAQSIAALAYGTEDFDPVDKIVGPGNIYVTLAKKEVFGDVGIDKLAGPSDVCIVADRSSNPRYVAADMLAQCEHDALASALLVTDSSELAYAVKKEIEIYLAKMKRTEIVKEALVNNSAIIVVKDKDINMIIDLVNLIAPEHLEVFHEEYKTLVNRIRNAGAIFLGEYSAEVLGDYVLGPNHVLPTGGTARYASALSCLDFVKTSSLISMDKRDFGVVGPDTMKFTELEDLPAHHEAIRVRM